MKEEPATSETLQRVIDFCHRHLSEDSEVYNYLSKDRDLSDETIRKFKLGAFPRNIYYLGKHIDAWDLSVAGIFQYRNGHNYSKFVHNNVIVPIFDVHGRPISVIGRCLLDEGKQKELGVHKYDNTVFSKGAHLFGLNEAKESIREQGYAVIVEGNFDVITAHQHGMTNVVATSGSWFTKRQARLLSRYTPTVHLMFDNDAMGHKATTRVLSRMPLPGLEMLGKSIPDPYKDLDQYFRERK